MKTWLSEIGRAVGCGVVLAGSLATLMHSGQAFAANDAKTKKAMAALQERLQKLGEPKTDGTATLDGKSVPVLFFGTTKINENYAVVDSVKADLGGTATVFVKSGEEFVRVSTNVLKDNGDRAVGTTLARNDAYKAIVAGKEFCGQVDILGNPYDTCYAPIKGKTSETIGVYYVGYRKR